MKSIWTWIKKFLVRHDQVVPFCAECNKVISDQQSGQPAKCNLDAKHFAEFVKGSGGEKWLRIEYWLSKFQTCYSLSAIWDKKLGHSIDIYVFLRFFLLLIGTGWFALMDNFFVRYLVGGFALYWVLEILMIHTSIAFVRQGPTSVLRSVILSFVAFLTLAICFSVFYLVWRSDFKPELDFIRSLYFSIVTVTTLGYGDIKPRSGVTQLLVMAEVIVGIYFLAIIISIISGWAGNRSERANKKTDLSTL